MHVCVCVCALFFFFLLLGRFVFFSIRLISQVIGTTWTRKFFHLFFLIYIYIYIHDLFRLIYLLLRIGSNTPQDTNCTATCPPITKTIQVRRTRHAGHCWRSRDELIRDVLLWIPTHGRAKAGRPARTYIQQLCEDTGSCPEDLPRAMNDREEWRERVRDIRAASTIWWWWIYLWFIVLIITLWLRCHVYKVCWKNCIYHARNKRRMKRWFFFKTVLLAFTDIFLLRNTEIFVFFCKWNY